MLRRLGSGNLAKRPHVRACRKSPAKSSDCLRPVDDLTYLFGGPVFSMSIPVVPVFNMHSVFAVMYGTAPIGIAKLVPLCRELFAFRFAFVFLWRLLLRFPGIFSWRAKPPSARQCPRHPTPLPRRPLTCQALLQRIPPFQNITVPAPAFLATAQMFVD